MASKQDRYAQVRQHGPIVRVTDDIWQIEGTFPVGMGMTITRNMTVLREAGDLTVVNSVRLDEATERELLKLGNVRHVVKLGHFHGVDDPYYVGKFSAKLWAQKGAKHYAGLSTEREISEAGPTPLDGFGAAWFVFHHAKMPEAALFLSKAGILVTCDSVQNWLPGLPGCSWFARFMMPKMGFPPGPLVGPFWRKYMKIEGKPLSEDFARLVELPISQVLVAHGVPIRANASAAIREAAQKAFAK